MTQTALFGDAPIKASIEGLVYQPEFLSRDEEEQLIAIINTLPLHAARYKQYLARRRVMSFGGSYDFDTNRLLLGVELDQRLIELRDKVARLINVQPHDLAHAPVAEYATGTQPGWHRDVQAFESIVGVSLWGHGTLRFRPHPDLPATRKVLQLEVTPRLIYKMTGDAQWGWQHCVAQPI